MQIYFWIINISVPPKVIEENVSPPFFHVPLEMFLDLSPLFKQGGKKEFPHFTKGVGGQYEGCNELISQFTSAARLNLELKNPTFLGWKNEVSTTTDMWL